MSYSRNYVGDTNFGLNNQARAILAMLSSCEPHWAEYKDGCYDMEFSTFPFHNGREHAIAVVGRTGIISDSLTVVFGEDRHSDGIFVDSWEKDGGYFNSPTVADFPEKAYKARTNFGPGEVGKAVDFIMDLFEKFYHVAKGRQASSLRKLATPEGRAKQTPTEPAPDPDKE